MAKSLNVVTLIGNVGQDPDCKKSGEISICSFSLATTKSWKDAQTGEARTNTQWHRIVVWRKLAEIVEKYVNKGDRLHITGELTYRSYETETGEKKTITEIVMQDMIMLSTPGAPKSLTQPTGNAPADPNDEPADDLPF